MYHHVAGVAVLSKHKPLSVTKDLPGHPDGDAVLGRIVTLEFEKLYLVCTYVTNAGQGLKVRFLRYIVSAVPMSSSANVCIGLDAFRERGVE